VRESSDLQQVLEDQSIKYSHADSSWKWINNESPIIKPDPESPLSKSEEQTTFQELSPNIVYFDDLFAGLK